MTIGELCLLINEYSKMLKEVNNNSKVDEKLANELREVISQQLQALKNRP